MPSASASPLAPIGVFDSGVGGLTVLRALTQALPDERFVYLGDTAYMPYGSLSLETLTERVAAILQWFRHAHQVKAVVVACNSSAGLLHGQFPTLAGDPDLLVVDPITPVVTWLAEMTPYRHLALLATPNTVRSRRYELALQELAPALSLAGLPCDGLARLIEDGQADSPACEALLRGVLTPEALGPAEALILGCTHYPWAAETIRRVLPRPLPLLDPADWVAPALRRRLRDAGLLAPKASTAEPAPRRFVTADAGRFDEVLSRLPGLAVGGPPTAATDLMSPFNEGVTQPETGVSPP